jgi:hypothetical protein
MTITEQEFERPGTRIYAKDIGVETFGYDTILVVPFITCLPIKFQSPK